MILACVNKNNKTKNHLVKSEGSNSTLCGEGLEKADWTVEIRGAWLSCRKCKELVNAVFRGKGPQIDRLYVLNRILECFVQAHQEKIRKSSKDSKHLAGAEELIKTLEMSDTGSYGGHDKYNDGIPNLFMRFEWLVYKYNSPLDLTLADRYEELRKFF
jgi:hypothetical protein